MASPAVVPAPADTVVPPAPDAVDPAIPTPPGITGLKTGLPPQRSQPEAAAGLGWVGLAWLASLLVVGGGLLALWWYQDLVVAAWPPAGRLLELLDL